MAVKASKVDHTALKFNQACIISLLLLAFLLNQPWLVAFVGFVMLVGTIRPQAGLFKWIYSSVLRPTGLLRSQVIVDQPQPHLFAQGLGAIFLIAATVALYGGVAILGWTLSLIVVVLAAVNLFLGFCLGCFMYYQAARRGVQLDLPSWRPA
jgi:hypothetical protein